MSSPRAHFVLSKGTYLRGWDNSTFDPIPTLRREDADTHVIAFHNNALRFYSPTDDPIFAAHVKKEVSFDNNSTKTMYVADKPASFLGCAEQVCLYSLHPAVLRVENLLSIRCDSVSLKKAVHNSLGQVRHISKRGIWRQRLSKTQHFATYSFNLLPSTQHHEHLWWRPGTLFLFS